MSDLQILDQAALIWVNGFVGRWPAFDDLVRVTSDWNFFRAVWLALFLVWAWFRYSEHDQRLKLVSGMAGLCIATATSRALQILLSVHPRPFTLADDLHLAVPRNVYLKWGHGSCYPSDTATLYFAFAAIIWSLSWRWGAAAFVWVAAVIALPRVYLLYHWPSDIVAGLVLGVACVQFAQVNRRVMPLFAATLEAESIRPQLFYPAIFVLLYQIIDSFDAVEKLLHHLGAIRHHAAVAAMAGLP